MINCDFCKHEIICNFKDEFNQIRNNNSHLKQITIICNHFETNNINFGKRATWVNGVDYVELKHKGNVTFDNSLGFKAEVIGGQNE